MGLAVELLHEDSEEEADSSDINMSEEFGLENTNQIDNQELSSTEKDEDDESVIPDL